MRIAIFSDSLPPRLDGIAVAVQQLAVGLVRAGHQVLLIGPGENVAEGAQFLRLPSIRTPFDGYRLAVPIRSNMDRTLQLFRPDVVSAQTVGPVGLRGLALAREQGVPSLFSWHTDFETYGQAYRISPRLIAAGSYCPFILDQRRAPDKGPIPQPGASRGLIPASLRRASRWMSAVSAPSSGSADQVRRFGLQRPVYVMPADVNPDDLGLGSEAAHRALRAVPDAGVIPYLLFVGRLSREKNLELLIEAFIRAVPAPTRLVLVGPANDPRMRAMLESRAAELPDRIVLIGALPRTHLGEIYRSAAAFVTPSLSETQCLCVSEAIAAGVPVIAVDPQLAKDRPLGTVRVAQPNPEALGLAMTELLNTQRPCASPAAAKPLESLALRFVAAAGSVGGMRDGATLRWDEGRWITS